MLYSIGLTLLLISMKLDEWLGDEDEARKPKIRLLVVAFFTCVLFCALQDVALDGWSLTMLQR
jgi:hypothetical protein